MKKILSAILIALMALMILNASAETAAILTPDGMEWTAPAAGEAVTLEKDMGVIVENVFYSIYSPAGPLVTALGEPVETVSSPSCVFEGEDFEYNYDFGSIYSSPIEGEDIWYDFYIFDIGISTTRGLSVGDTVEKMLELYGENYYAEGEGMYTYSLSGIPGDMSSPCLIFESADGLITAMDIYYPTNI
ncbi:MAG: hypothetical protein IJO98_04215 [Clostridia bacterium]|nr:hypothetical protein [Clostridia bacterium]